MAEQLAPLDLAQIDVRVDDPSALPFDAPGTNTATAWNEREILWLGPDEWLVVGEAGTERAIVEDVERAVADRHHTVVDASAARIVFELDDGLDLLATGCPIDLDPSRWLPGACAQTLFGRIPVLLHQRDRRTTRVLVRASFASAFVARLDAVSRAGRASVAARRRSARPG